MVSAPDTLQFELPTGRLYADQAYVDRVEDGKAPRNLIQLLDIGRLLVGAAAEFGQDSHDNGLTVPLAEVLQADEYEGITTSAYEPVDIDGWEMDDYVGYGRWLDSLTKDPRQAKTGLSREVIKRAFHLGIGPSVGRIEHRQRFKNITSFYHACDVLPNRGLYAYDDWDGQQLADYAERVFLDMKRDAEAGGQVQSGYKLKLNAEIERRAHLGLGPALWIFKRHGGGGVMRFMAKNGYADPKNMEPEDYIKLGVKFRRANYGQPPTAAAMDFLALSRRSPTSHDIAVKFTWTGYLAEVKAAYDKQAPDKKILAIQQELQDGTLPPYIIKGLPAMEMIAMRAKWRLVSELLPDLSDGHRQSIAEQKTATGFASAVRFGSRGGLTAADIETAAEDIGVHEDIWRDDDGDENSWSGNTAYMDYLRVPPQLLAWGSMRHLADIIKGRQAA